MTISLTEYNFLLMIDKNVFFKHIKFLILIFFHLLLATITADITDATDATDTMDQDITSSTSEYTR